MRIRSHTTFTTIALAIIVLVAGVLSGLMIRDNLSKNLTKQYVAQEATIADELTINLKNEISSYVSRLEIIAAIPDIQNLGNDQACNTKLAEIFSITKSKLGNLARTNDQGVFICSINKALIGVPGSKLGTYIPEIFNDPLHKPVMSRAIIPPGLKEYIVGIHIPVYNTHKDFSGTLGGAVYLNNLKETYLKNIKFAENGFVTLIDENGDVLYHPDSSFIGKNLTSPELKKFLNNEGTLLNAHQKAISGHKGTVEYNAAGVRKIATYKPVNVLENRKWVVYATMPVTDAALSLNKAGLDQAFNMLMLILMLSILFVSIVLEVKNVRTFRLDRNLKIAQTELTTEKDSLATKVQARTAELEQLKNQLSTLVDAKTAELNSKLAEVERMNVTMIDREVKMVELKKINEELQAKISRA